MNLTPHFTTDEATFSSTAERLGIDNDVPAELLNNLVASANGMERVRSLLGGLPIHIDSWYRCLELNRAVNGAPDSDHLIGYAVDFICREYGNPIDIVHAIAASDVQFSKLIFEGTWCHISFAPDNNREILTANFGKSGTTYAKGA